MLHEEIIESLEEVPTEPIRIRAPRRESLNIVDRQNGVVTVHRVFAKLHQMYPELSTRVEQISCRRPTTFIPHDNRQDTRIFDAESSSLTEQEPITANTFLALQICLQRLQTAECSYLDIVDAYNAALYFLDRDARHVEIASDLRASTAYSAMLTYEETERTAGADVIIRIQKAAQSMIQRCRNVLSNDHIRRYLFHTRGFELLSIIRRTTEELNILCDPWLQNFSKDAQFEIKQVAYEHAQEKAGSSQITVQPNNDGELEILRAFRFEESELAGLDYIFSIQPKVNSEKTPS